MAIDRELRVLKARLNKLKKKDRAGRLAIEAELAAIEVNGLLIGDRWINTMHPNCEI